MMCILFLPGYLKAHIVFDLQGFGAPKSEAIVVAAIQTRSMGLFLRRIWGLGLREKSSRQVWCECMVLYWVYWGDETKLGCEQGYYRGLNNFQYYVGGSFS